MFRCRQWFDQASNGSMYKKIAESPPHVPSENSGSMYSFLLRKCHFSCFYPWVSVEWYYNNFTKLSQIWKITKLPIHSIELNGGTRNEICRFAYVHRFIVLAVYGGHRIPTKDPTFWKNANRIWAIETSRLNLEKKQMYFELLFNSQQR